MLARYQHEEAWQFLQHALESDVADVQGGTTAEGIHLGAMAGTVDIVLRCLSGLRARGPVLQWELVLGAGAELDGLVVDDDLDGRCATRARADLHVVLG